MRTAEHGWHLMNSSPPKHLASDHAQLGAVASRLHIYPLLAALFVDLRCIINYKEAGHIQAGKLCTMTILDLPAAIMDITYLATTDDTSFPIWRRALRYCIGYANGRVIAESAPYEPKDFEAIRKARVWETNRFVDFIITLPALLIFGFVFWLLGALTPTHLAFVTVSGAGSCVCLYYAVAPLRHRMFRHPDA